MPSRICRFHAPDEYNDHSHLQPPETCYQHRHPRSQHGRSQHWMPPSWRYKATWRINNRNAQAAKEQLQMRHRFCSICMKTIQMQHVTFKQLRWIDPFCCLIGSIAQDWSVFICDHYLSSPAQLTCSITFKNPSPLPSTADQNQIIESNM